METDPYILTGNRRRRRRRRDRARPVPPDTSPVDLLPPAQQTQLTNMETEQATWEDAFSNPEEHNPDDFTYVVTAMPEATLLAADPDDVASRPIISTSVIDNARPTTYQLVGLILDVPPSNVAAAGTEDLHIINQFETDVQAVEYALGLNEEHGLKPPDQLLAETESDFGYNEVTVLGTLGENETEAVGVFVVVGPDGKPLVEDMAAIEAFAEEHDLPIVGIPYPTSE